MSLNSKNAKIMKIYSQRKFSDLSKMAIDVNDTTIKDTILLGVTSDLQLGWDKQVNNIYNMINLLTLDFIF